VPTPTYPQFLKRPSSSTLKKRGEYWTLPFNASYAGLVAVAFDHTTNATISAWRRLAPPLPRRSEGLMWRLGSSTSWRDSNHHRVIRLPGLPREDPCSPSIPAANERRGRRLAPFNEHRHAGARPERDP
jgi:hypothetical protein